MLQDGNIYVESVKIHWSISDNGDEGLKIYTIGTEHDGKVGPN